MSDFKVVAVDQGTGSTKALLIDQNLHPIKSHNVEISLVTPEPGFVQQDPEEIYRSVVKAITGVSGDIVGHIRGLAITTQRESALAFSPDGRALTPLLSWQDRRTASAAVSATDSLKELVLDRTGLPLDPMFSALKFQWILDQIDPDRSSSRAGEILLGTVDSWLIYRLAHKHVVEAGNAHRTQLINLETGTWDSDLLLAFNIPVECLPKIISSDEPNLTIAEGVLKGCPLLAVMADSHAALFAHQSDLKITFGTGSSLMAKGRGAVKSGLVPTIAWKLGSETTHALEGNILASGATITYLARLFEKSVADLAELAQGRETDLVLVPAFGGLGAPWWDSEAKALAIGMTLDTDVADFARAGFESMAFQALDLISEFERSTSTPIGTVNVDGGPTSNPWFTQLLADLWQREVVARTVSELSAIGVARLALCSLQPDVELPVDEGTSYKPKLDAVAAKQKYNQWTDALQRSRKGE